MANQDFAPAAQDSALRQFVSYIFWPALLFLLGLAVWLGIQDYQLIGQKQALADFMTKAEPAATEASAITKRYVALMKDLVETAQTDAAAKKIVDDAIKAGFLRVKPTPTNGAASAAPPAPTGT
jgi:hypothetical protein